MSRRTSDAALSLIEAGADPLLADGWGWPPIHVAAAVNRSEILGIHVTACAGKSAADVIDIRDRQAETALHKAVGMLAALGADVQARTRLSETALSIRWWPS